MICFRLLDSKDPAQPLADAVQALAQNNASKDTYEVEPSSFRHVPNAPFAYWVSEKIRTFFKTLDKFECEERAAKTGMSTSDDFRFLRLSWEHRLPNYQKEREWFPYAKGGIESRYYCDIHLKCFWKHNGKEIKAWVVCNPSDSKTTHWSRRVANSDFFFKPGITWPRRTTSGMSMRVLPSGCIFADKGPSAFFRNGSSTMLATLAFCHSAPFQSLIGLQLAAADVAARSYEVGIIQKTPIPSLANKSTYLLRLAHSSWSIKLASDAANLTSHAFVAPALSPRTHTF
jgi:hypothetical protein